MEGKSVIGSLARVMRGVNVSMEVKRGLRNSILLLTVIMDQRHGHGRELSSPGCML